MEIKSNKIAVGCDIVNLNRFRKTVTAGGQNFLERVFTPQELKNKDPVHLAGIFAAKEAVVKALKLNPDDWKKMEIVYQKNGKPILKLMNEKNFKTADLSISHDGDYAIAVFVAILK